MITTNEIIAYCKQFEAASNEKEKMDLIYLVFRAGYNLSRDDCVRLVAGKLGIAADFKQR